MAGEYLGSRRKRMTGSEMNGGAIGEDAVVADYLKRLRVVELDSPGEIGSRMMAVSNEVMSRLIGKGRLDKARQVLGEYDRWARGSRSLRGAKRLVGKWRSVLAGGVSARKGGRA